MLELRKVNKIYDVGGVRHKVLKNINVNFRESEFAAILGPSGSGKTTLLNIIGGLDEYTTGDLKINEISTKNFRDADWDSYRNHRIGFVFQSYNLIPHQTVLANVKLALTLSGVSKREANRRAKRALEDVGLAEHINKKPNQLSGGQMQRVAIARALVNNPDILLADEPTGALDSETSLAIMDLLAKIAQTKLVIMVTHNPELADKYANRIITLKDGEITSDSNVYDGKINTKADAAETKRKQKKTKMSFWTALSLSLKNLLTKKGRTVLVSFAGSIGIIGIALIMAVSTGMQNYIDQIQADTLTSYPLTIERETADITGVLLNAALNSGGAINDGKVHENQVITSTLGSVTSNNLKAFRQYVQNHESEIKDDLRLVEDKYSVDPLIYTIDATGELAKLNPNSLFTSLMGTSSVMETYSSMTSVFQQKDRSTLEDDLRILAGRLPENYNEIVIILSEEGKIGDLLTYSLGLHDTGELAEAIAGIMSGKTASFEDEPLTLTYEELMGLDLRLLYATDTYQYNEKYNVYEDMADDTEYMMSLYDKAERLKIVGITTPKDDMTMSISGVAYLPELVTHIIDKAAQTEIVQKQLAEPEIDIFSDKKFGEDDKEFAFEFGDLVSIDKDKLSQAFGMDVDQTAITDTTKEYINEIADDITADVSPVEGVLMERFEDLRAGLKSDLMGKISRGEIDLADLESYVEQFVEQADLADLETKYLVPEEQFRAMFAGLLKVSLPDILEEIVSSLESLVSSGMGMIGSGVNSGIGSEDNAGGDVGGNVGAGTSGTGFDAGSGAGFSGAGSGASSFGAGESGVSTGDGDSGNASAGLSGDTTGGLGDSMADDLSKLPILISGLEQVVAAMREQMGGVSATTLVETTIQTFAVTITEVMMKSEILSKVGGLAAYLSNSFASAFNVDESAIVSAFKLNFTEDELARVVTAMFNKTKSSLAGNLATLGYQELDEPTYLQFYFNSFDGKTRFLEFIDKYNELMRSYGKEDDIIQYTDATGALMDSVKVIVDAVSYVLIAFVSISLVVSSIMIGIITYISVYERTKEIGILRAIGASKHNISSIFNAETFIVGLLAGLFGILITYLFIPLINLVLKHFTGDVPLYVTLPFVNAIVLVGLSIVLTLIGGIIPAKAAAKKDPVEALRSE